jgi:arginine utilization protein RocB
MNTITANELKTHLYIVAADGMEGRETGSAGQKQELTLSINKKNNISFPKAATSFYKKVPAAFLNAKRNENLPDSENIWAFIEGSEKPNEILVSAHYDHVSKKMVISIMALMMMAQEQLHYLKLLKHSKKTVMVQNVPYVFACNR